MSQTVHIRLRLDETLQASDRVVHRLDLREILAADEMVELLVEALDSRGFEREDDSTLRRTRQTGEVQTVDLDSLEVVTELSTQRELAGEVDATIDVEFNRRGQEDAFRQKVVGAEREALREQVTEQLAEGDAARRQELNEVLEEVYAASLKKKAARLGKVVSEHESRSENGEYELVIKVEV